MRHVPIGELKDRLSEMVAAAQAGEDIAITRHGREVATLIGPMQNREAATRVALQRLSEFRTELRRRQVLVTSAEWIDWKSEERR